MSALPYIPPRREYKYLVPEERVPALRRALTPFCALDRHAAAAAEQQYPISSLYFDTPHFELYWASRMEQVGRLKVRVRGYGEAGPVFLELKRKPGGVVRKARVQIPREGWRERVAGPLPSGAGAVEQDFRTQLSLHALEPRLLVTYQREAWVGTYDAYARVTFDRQVRFQPVSELTLEGDPRAWQPLDDARSTREVRHGVVVELKCDADAAPVWMARLVEQLGLWRLSYSKFCTGVELGFGRRHPLSLAPVAPTW